MNSNNKIGLDVLGTNGDRHSRSRAIRSHESGMSVVSRLKDPRMVSARLKNVKAVSMLLVCAAAIILASAIVVASSPQVSGNTTQATPQPMDVPPPPFNVFGFTYDVDGSTPVVSCTVNITNTRTGESNITNSDDTYGYYEFNMNNWTLGYQNGDVVYIVATKDTQIGWNNGTINTLGPYLWVDVTLSGTAIPEFPLVVLPVAGMLALFTVVSLKRRSEEQ